MTGRVLGAESDGEGVQGLGPLFSWALLWAHSCLFNPYPRSAHSPALSEPQRSSQKCPSRMCTLSCPIFPLENWSFPSATVLLLMCFVAATRCLAESTGLFWDRCTDLQCTRQWSVLRKGWFFFLSPPLLPTFSHDGVPYCPALSDSPNHPTLSICTRTTKHGWWTLTAWYKL